MITEVELSILQTLRTKIESSINSVNSSEDRQNFITEVSEIALNTGIRDSDDVLRALYTLEGKQLVQPEPVGDFTSTKWQITTHGLKALQIFANG